jgi:hypothetical protein
MKEFRCIWQQCPHSQHPRQITFIEATDELTAKAILKDHIERHHGIEWFSIHIVEEYVRPRGGRVLP